MNQSMEQGHLKMLIAQNQSGEKKSTACKLFLLATLTEKQLCFVYVCAYAWRVLLVYAQVHEKFSKSNLRELALHFLAF